MIINNLMVYREDHQFHPGSIYIQGDKIAAEPGVNEAVIDGKGAYAIPGLTDIHFHGCVGYDFCDGTQEAIAAIANYEALQGVTQICPATMTLPEEVLAKVCKEAAAYENEEGATLCGINLEGPYLSIAKKGAQNEAFLHKPDAEMFSRLNNLSGGMIKLVALAPEEEGAMAFIDTVKADTIISIAHTTADYGTAMEAFARGASHVTHLYNAMPPFTHRAPGVIGAAADTNNCHVELICDGIHIEPAVIRATFKLFGADKIILISDSMMATGIQDGEYSLGGQAVSVIGNKATLEDGTIAGSVTNLMNCVRTAIKMGIPFETAVKCATENPAREIGIYNSYGSLEAGKTANLVLLNNDLSTKAVFLKGKCLKEYQKNIV